MLKQAMAEVSSLGGRAIVTEPDGRTYVFREGEEEGPIEWTHVHRGMFLQPGEHPTEIIPAGEYPYPEVARPVRLYRNRQSALTMFLMLLDSRLSLAARSELAEPLEDLLAVNEVFVWLKRICLEAPMPEEADAANGPKEGRAGEILRLMVAKWRPESKQSDSN